MLNQESLLRDVHGSEITDVSLNTGLKSSLLLVSPSKYRALVQNLGLGLVYTLVNNSGRIRAERSCLYEEELNEILKLNGESIKSIETRTPAGKFDVIGFSFSNPLQLKDFFKWVSLAGLPVLSSERTEDHPLFIAGGMGITNPEPYTPFIDAFFMGDAQNNMQNFSNLFNRDEPKQRTLEKLASLGGVYVPSLSDDRTRVESVHEKDLSLLLSPIISGQEASLIVDNGCKFGCLYCEYTFNRGRKYSAFNLERICDSIDQASQKGVRKLFVYSASSANHPQIEKVIRFIESKGIVAEIQATRGEQIDDPFLRHLSVNIGSLSLNLDAPSDRIRNVVKPGSLTEKGFYDLAVKANKNFGINNLSVYYIINYPGELEADRNNIPNFVNSLLDISPNVRINLYVNPLFPSPNTPLERFPMENPQTTNLRLGEIWAKINPSAKNTNFLDTRVYKFSTHSQHFTGGRVALMTIPLADQVIEGLSLKGDRNAGLLLYDLYRKGLFVNGTDESRILEYLGNTTDLANYLGEIPLSTRLPWFRVRPSKTSVYLDKKYTEVRGNLL